MSETGVQRLARLVRRRRDSLGLTHVQVHSDGGPSVATQQRIERGDGFQLRGQTAASLERILRWEEGSIAAILDGGDPTEVGFSIKGGVTSAGQQFTATFDLGEPITETELRELRAAAEAEVLKRWREMKGT